MSGSTSVLDSLQPVVAPPGMAAKSGTSILDNLPTVQPTPGMVATAQTEAPQQSSWGDLGQQLWTGVKQGVVGMANAPLTLLNAEGDLLKRTINGGAGKEVLPDKQIAGLPTPQGPEPKDFAGRAARAIGQMAPAIPLAGAGAEAPIATMGRTVLPTAIGAVAGQAAEDAAPEALKPAAMIAGNLAGGIGGAVAQEGVLSAVRGVGQRAGMMGLGGKENVGGVNATGPQVQAAAGQIKEALGPEGTQRLMNVLPDYQDQLVRGSAPTTAQVAQTPGAAALEKVHRTATPEPFLAREQAQNNARTASIQSLAPTDAQPGAVGQFFRQQLSDLDQQGQQAIAQARGGVQSATGALGGAGEPATYGADIRGALSTADAAQAQKASRLWQAVDPDGSLTLPLGAVQQTARDLLKDMRPGLGDVTGGQELQILNGAAGLPDVVPFRDAQRLRSNIGFAERALRVQPGNEQSLRRLGMVKGALDDAIANAAETAAQSDPGVAGRLAALNDTGLVAGPDGLANPGQGVRGSLPGGNSGPSGASALPQRAGSSNAGNGPTGLGGSDSSLAAGAAVEGQSSPLTANFDAGAADRYAAARQATLERKQTFGQGPIGRVLQGGKYGEQYAVPNADVPTRIFTGSPAEPEQVQKFIGAVGQQQAAEIGRNVLANDLRQRGIVKPDGTLDAGRFATWQSKRQPTLSQFPGLSDQFANARAAQETLDTVEAAHRQAIRDFQSSAASHFISDDPLVAVRKAFSSGNPTETFGQLAKQVRGNADAEAGLKRAVVDYIVEKARSATPSGESEDFLKPAVFRNFIRQNSGALKSLFGGQGVQNLDMVAADLRRQAQRVTATAGSDTAANVVKLQKTGMGLKEGAHLTALAVIGDQLGEAVGHAFGGAHAGLAGMVAGPLAAGAGYLVHSLRQSGIRTVNDLVREAMLNPNLARELMARVPESGQIGSRTLRRIGTALQPTAAGVVANQSQQ